MAYKEWEEFPAFEDKVENKEYLWTAPEIKVVQMNITRKCNLACKHCHLQAGPNRTESMDKKTMEDCLVFCKNNNVETIDITGGAPELNKDFRWLIDEASKIVKNVIVRTNLVILLDEEYKDLMAEYARHHINLVASLPHYTKDTMDNIRGEGTFEKSITVIKELNKLGYGKDANLKLDFVYNPSGAFFPPNQSSMEKEYKEKLYDEYGIVFNNLFTITNNPIGRFGDFLVRSNNMKQYMQKLIGAFNEDTVPNMMCRFQISVSPEGYVYDCDFNQALDMKIESGENIHELSLKPYNKRRICFDKHCFACTAGAGSSCGGSTS